MSRQDQESILLRLDHRNLEKTDFPRIKRIYEAILARDKPLERTTIEAGITNGRGWNSERWNNRERAALQRRVVESVKIGASAPVRSALRSWVKRVTSSAG